MGSSLTKIVGYNDRQYVSNPWHLHRVELTFKNIDGTQPDKIVNQGSGFSAFSLQQLAGTISIDYFKVTVSKVNLGFDQWTMTTVEVITSDGVSQKFDGRQSTSVVNTISLNINGYLVGATGRAGAGVDALSLRYKLKPA